VGYLFKALRVTGSRDMVQRYIRPVEVHRPLPESLATAGAR
jgi:hypothetical protein